MSNVSGIGTTSLELPSGRKLPFSALAFLVQGLQEIPKDPPFDLSLYLSQWQSSPITLSDDDGNVYVFRVIDVAAGHAPESVDEVREQVVADLRLLHGMDRAEQAGKQFAENVGTSGLKAAWDADTELADQVTPDDGGYSVAPRFARSFMGRKNMVPTLGVVPDSFMDEAFEMARKLDEDGGITPAVERVPGLAEVVVFSPMGYFPIYERDYDAQRRMLRQQFARQQAMELIFDWLDPQQIRERNQFKMANEA